MESDGLVTIGVQDAVATVTVDHPPANALDGPTLRALTAAAERVAQDRGVRAVVLTGAGTKAFVAGADLHVLAGLVGRPGGLDDHLAICDPAFDAWRRMPQPVIAAVQAHALGGGLELALLCDLIVADSHALFGLPEVTLGLIPGAGGTQRLIHRVGAGAAMRLLLTGEMISAVRAHQLGIVDEVAEEGGAVDLAIGLGQHLAALPGEAVRAVKRAARFALEGGDLNAGLVLERDLFRQAAASADAAEGTAAFVAKRPPQFRHGV